MIRTLLHILIFIFASVSCMGFNEDTLSLKAYLNIVLENHPLIKKANLYDDIREAYGLKGRGVLDPKISSDFTRKYFDDTDYFTVWQTEAQVPTVLPIDLSVGYERNNGLFLNEENNVPANGLIYGTINLSILRGLLFDDQRFRIQLAELNGVKSQIEKEILTREILYQAIYSYIDWTRMENNLIMNQNYLRLVTERHQNVVELFINGDIPAIDTIESRLNLNSADKLFLESRDKLIKAVQNISLFIWDGDENPMRLNRSISPMDFERLLDELNELSLMLDPSLIDDPLIRKFDNEIQALELTNRLERENLKPQLDLKYNTILNLGKDELNPTFGLNDYKYGITFQLPILNRKTKGELKLNETLIRQNQFDKTQYLGSLTNKLEGLSSRRVVQTESLGISREKVTNSLLLYEAEQLKFNLGESSVFLLNQRERKLLESQIELVKNYDALSKILNELYYLKLGQR